MSFVSPINSLLSLSPSRSFLPIVFFPNDITLLAFVYSSSVCKHHQILSVSRLTYHSTSAFCNFVASPGLIFSWWFYLVFMDLFIFSMMIASSLKLILHCILSFQVEIIIVILASVRVILIRLHLGLANQQRWDPERWCMGGVDILKLPLLDRVIRYCQHCQICLFDWPFSYCPFCSGWKYTICLNLSAAFSLPRDRNIHLLGKHSLSVIIVRKKTQRRLDIMFYSYISYHKSINWIFDKHEWGRARERENEMR